MFSLNILAQNLVFNPSFEEYCLCPNNSSQVYKARGWSSFGNTSDYFNSCDPSLAQSVPVNTQGYQWAVDSGNAYCGIYTRWGGFPVDTSYGEFIGSKLLSPLIPNQQYYVQIKVNSANKIGQRCATNKTGVLPFRPAPR